MTHFGNCTGSWYDSLGNCTGSWYDSLGNCTGSWYDSLGNCTGSWYDSLGNCTGHPITASVSSGDRDLVDLMSKSPGSPDGSLVVGWPMFYRLRHAMCKLS
jgi:hypothetical protein